MAAPLVIFDLDGTLLHTAPDLIDSLNHTITQADLAPVDFEDLTHLVGQGVRVMIERAFELRRQPLDNDTAARLFDTFIAHYQANIPGRSQPYPGMIDCLDRLERAGFQLAICTNKSERLTHPLLEKLGLANRFGTITCGDTFPTRKPDAAHIFGTIERAGGDRAASVMVGDSINDILAARNACIPSIGVAFGYSDPPVAMLEPQRVVETYDELTVELVHGLLG